MIGADGIHSRTRQIIDPDAPKARHPGIVGRRRTASPDSRLLTPYFLRRAAKGGIGSLDWIFDHRIDRAGRVDHARA
ncbi:hypothetical protein OG979_38975 [Actinomadura citrea]|uniref:hypothetical protein n=1 Tax=Actinomadura citrea TaxID=46158 RepID=UPI002E2997F4|nr:hypothetical protein [Actinomadura citrea]